MSTCMHVSAHCRAGMNAHTRTPTHVFNAQFRLDTTMFSQCVMYSVTMLLTYLALRLCCCGCIDFLRHSLHQLSQLLSELVIRSASKSGTLPWSTGMLPSTSKQSQEELLRPNLGIHGTIPSDLLRQNSVPKHTKSRIWLQAHHCLRRWRCGWLDILNPPASSGPGLVPAWALPWRPLPQSIPALSQAWCLLRRTRARGSGRSPGPGGWGARDCQGLGAVWVGIGGSQGRGAMGSA